MKPDKIPPLATIVLAAGKGTRMKSDLPKVVHKLGGIPMVTRVVRLSQFIGSEKTVVIVGYKAEMVQEALSMENVEFARQEQQLGTGHAVEQSREFLQNFPGNILILSGDVPLLTPETLRKLIATHIQTWAAATILTADVNDPTGYGRVIRTEKDTLLKIVEQKDANTVELLVNEINSGIYLIDSKILFDLLPLIKNKNAQKEYYLPDILPLVLSRNKKVSIEKTENSYEIQGVNTTKQLEELNEIFSN